MCIRGNTPLFINSNYYKMENLLKQYIDSLELNFLWNFQNEFYYENWNGQIISLRDIKKQFHKLSDTELDFLEKTIF